jgi:pimeloyl-ACP methyl ester carboxylesterase
LYGIHVIHQVRGTVNASQEDSCGYENNGGTTHQSAILKGMAGIGILCKRQMSKNTVALCVLGLLSVLPLPAFAQAFADLPGVRLWYVDTGGSGVPVVFLHSNTGSSANWEHQIPAFKAAGYRFIAYDRRGWGRSMAKPGAAPGTGADDLHELMKSLKIDRFHLVGTAGGGFVALDYALSFPEQIRSLVIANSIGGVQDDDYLELGRRLRPPQFDALPPELREVGPSYRASNPDGTRRWIELEHMSRQDGAAAQPYRNRMTFSLLEKIAVPSLFLTGDADLYAPPPVLKLFTARIRNSESKIIPEAGHSTYWEQPETFNNVLLTFFRKH